VKRKKHLKMMIILIILKIKEKGTKLLLILTNK
jgi:hypothetical protein